eukprot:scaffold8531_cov130-Isochrysis_galbana.AAC.11
MIHHAADLGRGTLRVGLKPLRSTNSTIAQQMPPDIACARLHMDARSHVARAAGFAHPLPDASL